MGQKRLEEFAARHADVRSQLDSWFSEAEEAHWKTPADIKARFHSASFLSDNRVVFNLAGNRYRLVAKIGYDLQVVLVQMIGTHAEYAKWRL